jgi:hypothetical protein
MQVSLERVRRNTAPHVNEKIDQQIREQIHKYARLSKADIGHRLLELEREWDIERWLETQASSLAFAGLLLGLTKDRRWFAVPAIVLPFLFMHGTQGWCPPVPVLRRLGVRTRSEIDCEKFALKALRGDFDHLPEFQADAGQSRADQIYNAVDN